MKRVGEPMLGTVPRRSPACEALITRIAGRIENRVDPIADRMIERVMAEMDLGTEDEDLHEDLLAAARGSVALITAMARTWTDPRVVPVPHDALVWARGLVARGLAIDALLRVYRIGQSGYHEVWHRELLASGEDPALLLEAMAAMAAFTFTWVDAISLPLVRAHEDERVRRLRSADAIRSETVQALLAGAPIDVVTAEARLGYRLARAHVALIAWLEPDAPAEALDALDEHVGAATSALARPGTRPLLLREAPRIAFAWVVPDTTVADAAARMTARLEGTGVRVCLGAAGDGPDGFRSSHDQARRARRVARLLHLEAPVVAYPEVAVADLLTQDIDAARALARTTLGPLAGDDAHARRLLSTLQAFLQEGRSYARTARRLGVHENTVSYRVRRALETAGAADTDALWVAVQLAPLLRPEHP
ncbi:helix-turn-helix domain-containing protein [Paraconexibacter antarcticus]|uniref:Helix-turn-helix domain-containing protein n=1 Tax=Paraconexibacter antarcticus TaxID=2949664 RepID=A0ABY5DWP5_9ACTN|nr:helix-turn-helix domain-containing protein [Paraconexibacter antarcticus]UTI65354.1 helix-turn-helix domain-containing protein [Paraconexibacter antarcticus]